MKLAVIMDPIWDVITNKDTSFAMMLEAQARGYEVFYLQQRDMFLKAGEVFADMQAVAVKDDESDWYRLCEVEQRLLSEMDVVLMRKDPPFDMNYIYSTYLLELVEASGVLVANKPSSLRDANEKLFAAWFPQCCPETLVTSNQGKIFEFVAQYEQAIIKPLDGMGGHSIYRLSKQVSDAKSIIDDLTQQGSRLAMVQRYIPEIMQGDKRILMVNGEPVPYALARIPAANDFRGNIAQGASVEGRELTERDRWICQQVSSTLKAKGLMFVGLDVIGDYLTEINVTSPTCVRELDKLFDLNICAQLFDAIEEQWHAR